MHEPHIAFKKYYTPWNTHTLKCTFYSLSFGLSDISTADFIFPSICQSEAKHITADTHADYHRPVQYKRNDLGTAMMVFEGYIGI